MSSSPEHIASGIEDRFYRIKDRSHSLLGLASIPSSPRRVAWRRRPSSLPTHLRYFIFTLLSLFLSYTIGLMGLGVCSLTLLLLWSLWDSLSLSLFIWRLKNENELMKWLSLSLSLSLYDPLFFSLMFEL